LQLIRRELSFVSRINPDQYDPQVRAHDLGDVLLVRGTIDVLLDDGDGLHVLDYKTDRIDESHGADVAESYRPQLITYAAAISAIYSRPVRTCEIVFLHLRKIVQFDC
jgi:ATP-dependent helicase/nuclease subunit A